MTREELQSKISEIAPAATAIEGGEWLNMEVTPADWKNLAMLMRHTQGLDMDYLFCLTCVDWKTHLTMVYHLTSTTHRQTVVFKVKLDRVQPEVDTVCDIWRTAEFHEREVFELFGVDFKGHPDLRKLILPDDWQGFPLRKDYEDPINMIKL